MREAVIKQAELLLLRDRLRVKAEGKEQPFQQSLRGSSLQL
jgi:hypothetical protein